MAQKDVIIVQLGGIGEGRPNDVLNIQISCIIPIIINPNNGDKCLTVQGQVELNNCIAGLYELIVNQPRNQRLNYTRYWTSELAVALEPIIFKGQFTIESIAASTLRSIKPNFSIRVAQIDQLTGNFLNCAVLPGIMLPTYVDSESGGYVQFTPEFNIPTDFDNANFIRAEDDNYTNRINEFINSPQFELALHIRPKISKKCKKCHCKHKKNKTQVTTPTALKALVRFIYQTCLAVQTERISVEEGKNMIQSKIQDFEKYRSNGSFIYNFSIDEDGFIFITFCTRYHLANNDCIVGFTMEGTYDIFQKREEAEFNQIIMKASAVPIDEDMTDVVYPSNTGIFIWNDE